MARRHDTLLLCTIAVITRGRQANVSYRIINGSSVSISEYPFLVSVQRWEKDTKTHICGGTLISDLWVLTAGHCVVEIERDLSVIVRAESSYHSSGGVLLTVSRAVKHENFRYGSPEIDFDFGLLKLSSKFERAVPIRLIARHRRIPAGELCTVVGWGLTKGTGDREQLRMVRLPIVPQSVCSDAYSVFDPNSVTWRMLCAGYEEGRRDACEGDSGGPLLCRGIQVGIISWGVGCAKPNRYGVYSSISNQRSWIQQITAGAEGSSRRLSFRIVNGTASQISSYPYIVSIQRWTPTDKAHICGGTLISVSWILSAAHCVEYIVRLTPQTAMVRANSSFYRKGGKLHRVAQVIKHENFTYTTGDYDYGLLRLRQRYLRAALARLPSGERRFPPGELCVVLGWGYTLGPESREQLRSVALPIVAQSVCRKAYQSTDEITGRMMCAGYAEGLRDACDGDSGGPLICRGKQAGIISWAIGCAQPEKYGVYSSIAAGRQWIKRQTGV
ncbi:transmembrane protease serine 9-like [Anopheles albimanus]|uniref:transmembrane protease serine 9-like n=1 Tax=Anopheles albimanus TaxID=7167 RepID=UPI0016407B1A|nr:transmembrane protease serine 9-like [Anopheles albimanus]